MGKISNLAIEAYDREDAEVPYNQKKKEPLTTEQKINFIVECAIEKTREEREEYRKELAKKIPEEINLEYTKLNKKYWETIKAYINYRSEQSQPRYTYESNETIFEEEMEGPIL